MQPSKIILMSCSVLALWAGSMSVALAQTPAPAPSIPKVPAGLASSSAMQVYDSAMMECFKEVTQVDPSQLAQTKDKTKINKRSLNMDGNKFMRIQDCMTDKGVPANFENYFAGGNSGSDGKKGMSAAQRADLQAIQDSLNSGQAVAAPQQPQVLPQGVMAPVSAPVPVLAPPPEPVAPPINAAPEEPAKTDTVDSPKAPRPTKQYWVKPQ